MTKIIKIKDLLYLIYIVLFVAVGYMFLTAIQVPVDPTTIPDYVDDRLPNVKRYETTIAIIDRNGIEHYYPMAENGEPIFDEIDKDYTNPIYRDYLSYKYR